MNQKFGLAPQKILSVVLASSFLAACGGAAVPATPAPVTPSPVTPQSSSSTPAPVVESSSSVAPVSSASSSSVAPVVSSVPSSSSQPSSAPQPSSSSQPSSVSSSSSEASSAPAIDVDAANILGTDGTFSDGQGLFNSSVYTGVNAPFTWNNEVNVRVSGFTEETWHIQLTHPTSVIEGQEYTLCFRAKAKSPRTMSFLIDQNGTPGYDPVAGEYPADVGLTTIYEDVKYTFTSVVNDDTARLTMSFGAVAANGGVAADVQVDNIGLYRGSRCGLPNNVPKPIVGTGSDNIRGVPPITTKGNQVLFGGETGSIAGMSLFWSSHRAGYRFYTQGVVQKLANDWDAKLVRAAMGVDEGVGYIDDPQANTNRVKTIVNEAIANDMYVIIDWHTHNAEDHAPNLAPTFFREMANTYGTNNHVIYEIYNEPDCPRGIYGERCNFDNKTSWAEIKAYAIPVIKAIREIDPDNLIIIGTPYYSQFVDEASEDPITAADFPGNPDYAKNLAYTLHFYAATHKQELRNRAIVALRNGLPIFATEWGTVGALGNGDVDRAETDRWMEFLYDNNISHANWSISDKDEGASILKPRSNGENGWSQGDLTESGLYVKDRIKNW